MGGGSGSRDERLDRRLKVEGGEHLPNTLAPGARASSAEIFVAVGGSSSFTTSVRAARRHSARTLTGMSTPVAAGSSCTITGSPPPSAPQSRTASVRVRWLARSSAPS
jgi:hypothetical protein